MFTDEEDTRVKDFFIFKDECLTKFDIDLTQFRTEWNRIYYVRRFTDKTARKFINYRSGREYSSVNRYRLVNEIWAKFRSYYKL